LLAETESKYLRILEAERLLDIAGKDVESAETNLNNAEAKYIAGTLSQADLLRIKSDLASKRVTLIQKQNALQIAIEDFRSYLQLDYNPSIKDIEQNLYKDEVREIQALNQNKIDFLLAELQKIALTSNPAVESVKLSTKISSYSAASTLGNFLPAFSLNYRKNWLYSDLADTESEAISLNMSMQLFPLADNYFSWSKTNHDYRKAKLTEESTINTTMLSVRSSLFNIITAANTLSATEIARDYSLETYQMMQQRFNNGLISANDLLNSQIAYSTAENQYITAFYTYLKARSLLTQSLGIEDFRKIAELTKE